MFKKLVLIGLLSLGITACGSPKNDAPQFFDPAVDTWPQDISDIPADPDVRYGQLENGMRYALQKNGRPEGEGVVRFRIAAGSKHETDATLGLAHYLEHMAFNGSENVPEGEMVKSLERLGMSFGADTNASTTFNRTQYMLNLPDVGDETVDYALFLMRETADKLLIEPEAVDRERGVVKAEEARGNTPSRDARRAYIDFIYPDSLSRIRPVIGLPETLDTISAEQLRRFYDIYYRPERAILVITGDFDLDKMEGKIKTVFEDWKNETVNPEDPHPGMTVHREPAVEIYHDDELTTQITMFDAAPASARKDDLESRRARFLRSYANGIVNQRIRKRLLSSGAPVRSASISYSSNRYGDQLSANASAKNDDWAAAIVLLDDEIRKALEYGFQPAEYDELLANSRRGLTDNVNYAAKRRSSSLASGIVRSYARGSVRTTPQQSLEIFEANAKDVSLEDLELFFKNMWSEFDPLIWLQGPKVKDVTQEAVMAAYAATRSTTPEKPEERQKLEFAYQDFGTPGKIVSRSRVEDMDIDQYVFANNVRLNLKKTDFEDKWIRASVTVGEGWQAFGKEDAATLALARAFTLGGYEAHKVSELAEIFAGKQVGINLGISSERLSFSGGTNPDNFEDQLKAWAGLLTAPGYRPEWREKFLESISASFHTIDSTPGGVASRDLQRIWRSGDPRYGLLEQSAYEAATLDDVKAIMSPIMKDGAIEIGVVGDFDKDAVIAVVAKTFGALPARKAEFGFDAEAFKGTFPGSAEVELTHTGAENQGAIFMAWPTAIEWSLERSRHYGMVRRIFQNRMTEIIREDLGLTYSPSASIRYSQNDHDYGYLSASMTSDPQYFDPFSKAAKDIAADLRSGGITKDEVDRALKPVLEGFERALKENGAWTGLVTYSQTQPESLEWRRSRKGAYENMTPKALDKAAADLFDPSTLHIVRIGPEDKK